MKPTPSVGGEPDIKAIFRSAGIYQVGEDGPDVGARARTYREHLRLKNASKKEITLEEKYATLDTAFTIILAALLASLVLNIILLW